jgi:uncharacterized membrane protein YfcA
MLEPWQWAIAALAAYLVGVSKTGIPGLGVLSVALFASVLPARESTGIVLIILLAADVVSVLAYRGQASWSHLWRLMPWAVVGIVIGWLIMGRIDNLTTQRFIGGILALIVIVQVERRWQAQKALAAATVQSTIVNSASLATNTPTDIPTNIPTDIPTSTSTNNHHAHPILAPLAGVSAGITTMVANAAGPIMVLYLLAMGLPKMAFMGTTVWYFFILNLIKIPFSYSLGLITFDSLGQSLSLAPFAMAGAVTGRLIIRFINQALFEWLALVLTLVASVRLLLG